MHRLTTDSSNRKSNPTSIPLLFCVSMNVPAEPSKHRNTSRNCTYLTKMMEWQIHWQRNISMKTMVARIVQSDPLLLQHECV
jgi:hypothetical protein